ncbi:MAG TPA: hypothetical protein VMV27_05170 [Candidatus Binataceae bacterium]|nr:hypothetical protein [Candidatus Binataceae bacterium]
MGTPRLDPGRITRPFLVNIFIGLGLALNLLVVPDCSANEPLPVVPLIALIAQPQKYDGKRIVVTGFATMGFENTYLFLSPYDADEFTNNALLLDFRSVDKSRFQRWSRELDHKTVEVEGTFYLPKNAAFWTGYPNGIITKITSMQLRDVLLMEPHGPAARKQGPMHKQIMATPKLPPG